jgi:hypothetical protein
MISETMAFRIEGVAPLILHNGQLADPLNVFAKENKKLSGKRKKTDEDFVAMAQTEFMGSLYLANGRVTMPGENIESAIINAAKKRKLGTQFKVGMFVEEVKPLIYDGPKSPEALWDSGKFKDTRGVRVQQSRVMRTRPRFDSWAMEFVVKFDPQMIDPETLVQVVEICGYEIGLGDYRPRFGRFELASNGKAKAA